MLTHHFVIGKVQNEPILDQITGSKIIIANHSSYLDHFVILDILKNRFPNQEVYFLTKQEAFDSLFSNWWHTNLNCIPVDRSGDATKAMMELKRILKNKNATVVIYPEGTRTPTGEIYLGKSGAETLSLLTKTPIIPMGLHSAFEVLPKLTTKPNLKTKVDVSIGEPIFINKSEKHNLNELTLNHMKMLSELANENFAICDLEVDNLKAEMVNYLKKYNNLELRNYPKSYHTPIEYHNRSIYLGRMLIRHFNLTDSERSIIHTEIARAYGRIGYIHGTKTFSGKRFLKKAIDHIDQSQNYDPNNAENMYVKANYFNFINQPLKFRQWMELAIQKESENIKYNLSLAKAEISNHNFSNAQIILRKIILMNVANQVDKRRQVEATALLMRLDPEFEGVTNG